MLERPYAILALPAVLLALSCSGDGEGTGSAGAPAEEGPTPGAIPAAEAPGAGHPAPEQAVLQVDRPFHDFGDVPVGGGNVETAFTLTNGSEGPARLVAVYTSCMCTTATLVFGDGSREGPFGMPGHDLPTTLDRSLAGGESVRIEVSFDPGAHGPDALGPVTRGVAIHSGAGEVVVLKLAANVVR